MDTALAFCIRHRFLVIFAVLLLGAIGVRAARQVPIDAVPDVTNVQVQILTNAPALGPLEIERYVSAPIERVMSALPRVEEVRSLSRFGLSVVTVVFEEGTDIYFARNLVTERLGEAREEIPAGYGHPEIGPISSGLGEIYQFEVRGTPMCAPDTPPEAGCFTAMDLRGILDWHIALHLRTIPGVVEVNPFGGDLKTYEVAVDPHRLEALGLSLHEVFAALEANNANAGGGYVVRDAEQRLIRGEALITSLDDLARVRIATRGDGQVITVADIGQVAFAPLLRQGAVTRDGRGEVVTASVMMLIGANAGEVARAVRLRLDEIAKTLPPGVSIETYYDRAELVQRTIHTVATNLIVAGVLVMVVLLLLLGNLRGALLIALIIPISLLATLVAMLELEVSANLMSLGALDFGLIIDGAVVVIDNITRQLRQSGAKGDAVPGVVQRATAQVIRPVVFGTAIIMMVYLPILSLQGIEGKMFRPMATVVLVALAAALVLALTLVPALAAWFYRRGVRPQEPLVSRGLQRLYAPLLAGAMRLRLLLLLAAGGVLGGGAWLATTMGLEFIPNLDEGAIAMQAIRPASVSLEASIATTTRIEQTLLDTFPDEIATVISRTGRAEIATDPMGVEISDIYLMLHPRAQWRRVPDKEGLVEAVAAHLQREVPGQNYLFSQPIALRTNELISGARADVAVSLFGPDLEVLEAVGDHLTQIIAGVEGAADLDADQLAGLPVMRVIVDRAQAARHGLDGADILAAVEAMGGRQVGVVYEGQARYALQVRLQASARSDPKRIAGLRLATPSGHQVTLAEVAQILLEDGPAVISRESGQRRRTLQVNVRGRDLSSFVAEAQQRVHEAGALPPGYLVTWGGNFEKVQAAMARLHIAVPAALALIFLLLYTAFGAARPAVIIYLNIPVAAVGGVVALWLRGMPLSISAAVGFIALSGIAVLNGVVMVSTIRTLQGEGLPLAAATTQGAQLRLRAILMTAITDGIGFAPMALSTSAGAEVQRPLATVVIGGLVTATLLTLFVLPALYGWFGGPVRRDPTPPDPAGEAAPALNSQAFPVEKI